MDGDSDDSDDDRRRRRRRRRRSRSGRHSSSSDDSADDDSFGGDDEGRRGDKIHAPKMTLREMHAELVASQTNIMRGGRTGGDADPGSRVGGSNPEGDAEPPSTTTQPTVEEIVAMHEHLDDAKILRELRFGVRKATVSRMRAAEKKSQRRVTFAASPEQSPFDRQEAKTRSRTASDDDSGGGPMDVRGLAASSTDAHVGAVGRTVRVPVREERDGEEAGPEEEGMEGGGPLPGVESTAAVGTENASGGGADTGEDASVARDSARPSSPLRWRTNDAAEPSAESADQPAVERTSRRTHADRRSKSPGLDPTDSPATGWRTNPLADDEGLETPRD